MSNLHIVIYSELKQYGGGRETWLSYFLPGVFDSFESINIYALKNLEKREKNLVELSGLKINCFYTDEISFIKFINSTRKVLKRNIKSGDVCLMIGSIVEGSIAPWLKRNFSDTVKRVIWIRSIASHEISNRHGKMLYPLISFYEKKCLDSSDVVITNGKDTFEYYTKFWKKNKNKKLIAIPNAVDCKKFQFKRDWDSVKKINGVFIGRFEPEKGGKNLLDCIKKFNELHPDLLQYLNVEIWGKGSLSDAEMPVNVKYCGKALRDDIPNILEKAQIEFFLVDQNDNASGGLSHSLLEGLSSGCICMCSDIPAYNQVINEKNGILINLSNQSKFEKLITNMILDIKNDNTKLYETISEKAIETAKEYSIECHIGKFINIINNL